MFEEFITDITGMLISVLDEFLDNTPTSLTKTDFEVEYLRIQTALRADRISYVRMCQLCDSLAHVKKIWVKLNDIK